MRAKIYIVDPDCRRRTRISSELGERNLHAEIYKDFDEFCTLLPVEGVVLAADEEGEGDATSVAHFLRSRQTILPVVAYANQAFSRADSQRDARWRPRLPGVAVQPLAAGCGLRPPGRRGQRKLEEERIRAAAKTKVAKLSPRQTDVLVQLVNGLSNRAIGEVLGISPRTVEIHRGNMMRKLGAQSTSDAVRNALYAGIHEGFLFRG